jgi:hypothetical protein
MDHQLANMRAMIRDRLASNNNNLYGRIVLQYPLALAHTTYHVLVADIKTKISKLRRKNALTAHHVSFHLLSV